LVYVSASGAPADDSVVRLQAGPDGLPPVLGQAREVGEDELWLAGQTGENGYAVIRKRRLSAVISSRVLGLEPIGGCNSTSCM
jgi:hypothetical protein